MPSRELNNKYLYNGKELQNELGLYWYDYGARVYNEIRDLIKPVDATTELKIYKQYPGTFTDSKYKNRSFDPMFFSNLYSGDGKVPDVFKSIKPARMEINFDLEHPENIIISP